MRQKKMLKQKVMVKRVESSTNIISRRVSCDLLMAINFREQAKEKGFS